MNIASIQTKYATKKNEVLLNIKNLSDVLNTLISELSKKQSELPSSNANSTSYNSILSSTLKLEYDISDTQVKLQDAYAQLYSLQEEEKKEMILAVVDYTKKSENSILPYKLTTVWDDKKIDDEEKKYIFSMAVKTLIFVGIVVILIKLFKA